MIKEQSSFSYQKNISGPGYFIKIIILLLATIALTWYSRKKTNNPFKIEPSINVIADNNNFSLCYQSTKPVSSPSIIVNLKGDIAHTEIYQNIYKKPWYFISLNDMQYNDSLTPPPTKYWIRESAKTPHLPMNWPKPYLIDDETLTKTVIKKIYPFSDARIAYLLSFQKISILYINTLETKCSGNETSRFHEKIELLLLSNASKTAIRQFRSLFRPHYVIISNNSNRVTSEYQNVFIGTASEPKAINFTITNSHTILYRPLTKRASAYY